MERKNSWQLAEYTGHRTPHRFQHLLGRAEWEPDQVRDDVRGDVFEHLGQDDGVLIFDETPCAARVYPSWVGSRPVTVAGRLYKDRALPDQAERELAEHELHRLAIVALAMFVHRRQAVIATELDHDLATLLSHRDGAQAASGTPGAPSLSEQATGRFFFLHLSLIHI